MLPAQLDRNCSVFWWNDSFPTLNYACSLRLAQLVAGWQWVGVTILWRPVSAEAFQGIDFAFFCAGGSVSQCWAEEALRAGAIVIDNTSAFRLDPDVPLVVPEVNGEAALAHRGSSPIPTVPRLLWSWRSNPS